VKIDGLLKLLMEFMKSVCSQDDAIFSTVLDVSSDVQVFPHILYSYVGTSVSGLVIGFVLGG
jgi:hypothetical protein